VIVASNRRKGGGSSVKCFRLVSETGEQPLSNDGVVVQWDDEKEEDTFGELQLR